jgi:hypothetical protein
MSRGGKKIIHLMPSFSAKVKVDVDILREWWVTSIHASTRTIRDCKKKKNKSDEE